jgi:hypothetical protein
MILNTVTIAVVVHEADAGQLQVHEWWPSMLPAVQEGLWAHCLAVAAGHVGDMDAMQEARVRIPG